MELTRIEPFLDYLDSAHARTRRVVLCIPPADLEWAPAPGKFSFGDLVRHLASIERWMFAENVHGRPSRYPGHGRDLAQGFEGVVDYYDRMHADSRALFAALTADDLGRKCATPAGFPITTWKWMRSMLEHEAHHRGQLYLMLGLRDAPTPPLYGFNEREPQIPRCPICGCPKDEDHTDSLCEEVRTEKIVPRGTFDDCV